MSSATTASGSAGASTSPDTGSPDTRTSPADRKAGSIIHAHGAAPVHAVSRASVGIVVACPCGEVYELRPEYAGRLLACAACDRHLRAGSPARVTGDVDAGFDRDVFLLRERLLAISSKYEVQAADGVPILYVERPTFL